MIKLDKNKVEEVLDDLGIVCEIEASPTPFSYWTEYLILSRENDALFLSVMRNKVLGEVQHNDQGEPLDIDEIDGESIMKEEDGYYLGYDFVQDDNYGRVEVNAIDQSVLDWLKKTNFDIDDLSKIAIDDQSA